MAPFTVARVDTSIGPPLGPSVIAHETIINAHASVGRVGLVLDCDLERRINVLKAQLACRALTSRYPLVRVLSYPGDFLNFFGGWDDNLGGSRIRQKGDDDQQLLCTSVHRSEQPFIAQPGIFARTASSKTTMSFQALSLNAPKKLGDEKAAEGVRNRADICSFVLETVHQERPRMVAMCQCLESEANVSFPSICMNCTTACLHRDSQNSFIRVCSLALSIPTSPPKRSQEVPLSVSCR